MRFVAIACLLSTGCVYLDPIREHPSVTLSPAPTEPQTIYRGSRFVVTAELENPDRFDWRAVACSDPDGRECSDVPFYTTSGTMNAVELLVPVRIGKEDSPLTQSIVVSVLARDDRGALAGGAPTETYPITNAPPTLERRALGGGFTVGVLFDLFVKYGDPDDDPEAVTLEWAVIPPPMTDPMIVPYRVRDIPKVADGPMHFTAGQWLQALTAGPWQVQVTARDPLGATTVATFDLIVGPDQPPCLAQWSPIVPPADAVLPVTESMLFQVPVVIDGLDSYPQSSEASGTATFAWSILAPGSERQLLVGATGNSVELDPDVFALGDIVELRVEVFDRNHTPTACSDELPTCAVPSASCPQRQTWRLEIR